MNRAGSGCVLRKGEDMAAHAPPDNFEIEFFKWLKCSRNWGRGGGWRGWKTNE